LFTDLFLTKAFRHLAIFLSMLLVASIIICIGQRCTTFLGQGPQCIILSALEGQRQKHELNFRESSIEKDLFN